MMKGAASDYIKAKRQNAIYTDININAKLTGTTVNPVKKNGFFYNNVINVRLPKTCNITDCAGGVLTNTRSYALRMDFKQGKYYNHYVCQCKNDVIEDVNPDNCEVEDINGKNVVGCLCTPCAFN